MIKVMWDESSGALLSKFSRFFPHLTEEMHTVLLLCRGETRENFPLRNIFKEHLFYLCG
jgi:hypothetical protein